MHSMINFTDRYRKYSHYYSSKKATGEMFLSYMFVCDQQLAWFFHELKTLPRHFSYSIVF